MASIKSIITPVEKNPDGTIRQKAIVTGAIPKRAQGMNHISSFKFRKPVTLVTTPRRRSGLTPVTARSASKLRSGLSPIRPKPVQKLRSGLMPIRPCQPVEAAHNRPQLQRESDPATEKPAKKTVTIQRDTSKEGANSTFEVPHQRKTTVHTSACGNKAHKTCGVSNKQPSAATSSKLPSLLPKAVPPKNSGPKTATRVAITYSTRSRRCSNIGTASSMTPQEKRGKSRIPVPVNPSQMPKNTKHLGESIQYLLKREKELMDELVEVREKLALRQAEKIKESIIRSVGANALALTYDSPASAFNLRPPNRSSSVLQKPEGRIPVDFSTSSHSADSPREDLDFSAYCNSPIQKNIPPDVLLSVSKSKTPGSIFENYRRNCATLRSPRSVKRLRRSRSLSTHRMADGENSICERVLIQLKNLYA